MNGDVTEQMKAEAMATLRTWCLQKFAGAMMYVRCSAWSER